MLRSFSELSGESDLLDATMWRGAARSVVDGLFGFVLDEILSAMRGSIVSASKSSNCCFDWESLVNF